MAAIILWLLLGLLLGAGVRHEYGRLSA